jgi:predicted phage terminase large subunit-like protein
VENPLQYLAAMPEKKREAFLSSLTSRELLELEMLSEGLQEFIPRVSKKLKAPKHLTLLTDLFESTSERERQVVVSTPPQHGKTVTGEHALVWLMRRYPHKRHAYVTYEQTRAESISLETMHIALEAGLKFDGSRKIWRTQQGGGIIATGIGGPLTGYGVDGLMLVDDPVKNRVEAESSVMRERTDQWFRDVALTRVHPGASVVVVQTRWHEDDLAGRLIKRGWEKINLEAIATEDQPDGRKQGEALWEERWPAEWLTRVKRPGVGEFAWWSLFQGAPRPRGGALFGPEQSYEKLPEGADYVFRDAIGVDLAYSVKTHADWSVAVVLRKVMFVKDPKKLPLFYVLDVKREQVPAPQFKNTTLRRLRDKYPRAPMRWYAAGAEKGVGDFIRAAEGPTPGVPLEVLPAKGDKHTRAQPVAAAWNGTREGELTISPPRIFVPQNAPWLDPFLDELQGFTGINDLHDDQVDGIATAYDLLTGPVNHGPRAMTRPVSIMG